MKKILIPLLLAVSGGSAVQAQSDSSHFDIGSSRLEKKFTQYMSVKGEALEKMPFSNLAEAINVWLYGAYTQPSNLLYVVDGNIVPDVNGWSVYDIKEIVFVQSAAGKLSGMAAQEQLVLITTRRQNSKTPGLSYRLAGASSLVDRDYKHIPNGGNASSDVNMYHQYYVSGYYNREKVQLGVSANWLRDVVPPANSDTTHADIAAHFNRFRFNAWADVKVGAKNSLHVSVNAAPENTRQQYFSMTDHLPDSIDEKGKQFTINPYLQFNSAILPGLYNSFSAAYQSFNTNTTVRAIYRQNSMGADSLQKITQNEQSHIRAFVFRDHLSWARHIQGWAITPALDIQYTHLKLDNTTSRFQADNSGLPVGGYYAYYHGNGHIFTGSPSIDFSYKNVFSFGAGGFAFIPPADSRFVKAALFPFAHLSLDLLKLYNGDNGSSLQLFASVARNYDYTFSNGRLNDFTQVNTAAAPVSPYSIGVVSFYSGTLLNSPNWDIGDLYAAHTTWMAGLGFRRPNDRLVMNYYFERRTFTSTEAVMVFSPGGGSGILTYPHLLSNTHHVDIMAKLVEGPSFQWQSGITATAMRVKNTENYSSANPLPTGDLVPPVSWTGGWVNRIGYKHFIAGADVLYHVYYYQPFHGLNGFEYKQLNLFDLQDIYLGYKIQLAKTHEAEVYLNSRSLVQNSNSDLTDRRRFYGAGFTLTL